MFGHRNSHSDFEINRLWNPKLLKKNKNGKLCCLCFGVGGGGGNYMMNRSMSFTGVSDHHHHLTQKSPTTTNNMNDQDQVGEDDNLSDDGSHMMLGEKKKRLNLEQVRALEKSFELGNKLEPERKMQLAKALGLQPRQIAIWFQNRRARWKTKQLERDYDSLKKQFDVLKSDNDSLLAHNKKLHAEVHTNSTSLCTSSRYIFSKANLIKTISDLIDMNFFYKNH